MKLKPSISPLLLGLLLPFNTPALAAGNPPPTPQGDGSEGISYIGGSPRFGIGRDSKGGITGEAQIVLDEDTTSAKILEAWISGERGNNAGGFKFNYHWTATPLQGAKSGDTVNKVFLAADQNREKDQKITLGGGIETPRYFFSGSLSHALTGDRLIAENALSSSSLLFGTENGLAYNQMQTTTLRTRFLERAYDWGAGIRGGRFYKEQQIRLTGGLDHEWGKNAVHQATLSLTAEKFFEGSPHSVGLALEATRKTGSLEADRDDLRATLMWRYEFGGKSHRPEQRYRMVQVTLPATAEVSPPVVETVAATPARKEQRMVKTTASMSSDAFFGFNSAVLTPLATTELDKVIQTLKQSKIEGRVRVTGHTCDIGSDANNLKISARRAKAVANYLVKMGGLRAEQIVEEGKGEAQPRVPNKPETRHKNRRVELEFVTLGEKIEEIVVPGTPAATRSAAPVPREAKVEWRKEYIDEEPAWLRRALHNPAGHKRTVDYYRRVEADSTVRLGVRNYNQFPLLRDDSFMVGGYMPTELPVLANDTDPDGDTLRIISVTQPTFGTLYINDGKSIIFSPRTTFLTDNFSYSVTDGKGGTASAQVKLIDP